jgi:Transposase IS4
MFHKKRNFEELYNREEFSGTCQVQKKFKNKKAVKDKFGKVCYEQRSQLLGMPSPEFLKDHCLNAHSKPSKFVKAFLPVSDHLYNTKCSIERWCTYTNLKAMLSFAGEKKYPYPDFKPFTVAKLQQHLALYVVNRLCPSPRAEMKFQPQLVDPINGNDFIFLLFATNAKRRHRHFKAFSVMQDPWLIVPDRNKEPNWKIDPLLKHMNVVNVKAWKLGKAISVDEQTIGFQGNHKGKLCITYKAEGDGFQCDALCQGGYTYTFYFWNHPAPKKYIDQKMSPLHVRLMFMFDLLVKKYYGCGMDNLYIPAKFLAAAYQHEKSVLVSGVCRKGGRGFPKLVLQEEVKNRNEQLKVRGTVKAAVLKGDDDCVNLVAVSVYNTKPVHFLSMSCELIEWITKERKVFSSNTGKYEHLNF